MKNLDKKMQDKKNLFEMPFSAFLLIWTVLGCFQMFVPPFLIIIHCILLKILFNSIYCDLITVAIINVLIASNIHWTLVIWTTGFLLYFGSFLIDEHVYNMFVRRSSAY